ncbi:MAG: glycosyltransferase family 9 protein [Planctomycetota bacterium]
MQIKSGIGDAILALPMIHALTVAGYEVHAIVNKRVQTIANLCPDIKQSYRMEYRMSGFSRIASQIHILNRLKFRYFIGALPSNVVRDAFLPVILGIPNRIKHRSPHKERYRNYDFLFSGVHELEHNKSNVESNLLLLSLMNKHPGTGVRQFNISLPKDRVANTKKELIRMGYHEDKAAIGIHPGCKETWAFKRWPSENFADLISRLGRRRGLQIVLFGGPEEVELCDRIVRQSSAVPLNLCGRLILEGTMYAISLCKMFISNDSGLMHIATVFKIPVIGLFGHTSNEAATGPYGDKHVIIRKDAIEDITVGEVHKEAERLLDRMCIFQT